MAMTINSRTKRLNARGKRVMRFDVSFSDGTAGTFSKAVTGLKKVLEVASVVRSASVISLTLTSNTDNTSVVVTPSGAAANVIIELTGTE